MARRLIILEDVPKSVDGGGVVAAVEIEPPDRHFLAGQLILGDRNLVFRVVRIFRLRVFLNDGLKGLEGDPSVSAIGHIVLATILAFRLA